MEKSTITVEPEQAKAPVAKKRRKRKKVAAKVSSTASLEKRLGALEVNIDKIVDVLESKFPEPAPPKPKKAPFKFMFMSPHKRFVQVLVPGRKKAIGDEIELIPPVVADFSDSTPGPMGFWGTDEAEMAELMRRQMKKKFRKEVIEVTNDPNYNPELLKEEEQEKKRAVRRA